jgi:hypothetical protein
VITAGGIKPWAICPGCASRGSASLSHAWGQLALWVLGLLCTLGAVVALVELLAR